MKSVLLILKTHLETFKVGFYFRKIEMKDVDVDEDIPADVVRSDAGFFINGHKLPISATASLRDIWIARREYKDWEDSEETPGEDTTLSQE